jgi:hypothetical protein
MNVNKIHRLGLAKAAGPDGLPAEFYKSSEELIVHDLYNTLIEAHGLGFLPPTMREGDNEKYIDTENNYHYFQNKKITTNASFTQGR